jgi:pimeloyl-ACP methyl ester carboxylesterase
VLLHGLASNCLTWEAVARRLHAAGHPVVAVDQRGHGLSDKPDTGYGFDDVTADLQALIAALDLPARPIVAGQSWGANVALAFAARYPHDARGLVLVDGGVGALSARPGATWERIAIELRPPPLAGLRRADLAARIRTAHPDWSDEGLERTLANFETLPDDTIRPWLSEERHMAILRALWKHHPPQLYPLVQVPALIVLAATGDAAWTAQKRAGVRQARQALARCRVRWFPGTDHDIHVHRPQALAQLMRDALSDGFF